MGQDFDLWGDPIPPPVERRGRPVHEPNDEKRLRVAVLRAMNQSNAEIAAAMGVSEPTLRKHYFSELKQGLAQKRAEVLVLMFQAARKGNVAAQKAFIQQAERADLGRLPPRPDRPRRLGKKEQQAIDAATPDPGTSMGDLMARRSAREQLH